ncbi:MAG: spore coat protein CotH, partial [Saprospiraceae bacterium]
MNKYLFLLTFSIFTLCNKSLVAQTNLYNIDLIPEIRIYFEQTNWDHILDSLYVDGNQDRLLATVSIDGTVLDSVGIRYKGFSSVSTNRDKNPFNIKLDY